MIKSVTVQNHLNESITISLTDSEPAHGLMIKEITGLGPAEANINMSEFATYDGALYNSARLQTRDIQFSFILFKAPDIETARQNTYKYFPIKKQVKLIFETDNRLAKCSGYVKTNEPDIFSQQESVNIVVTCPDPNFYIYRSDSNSESFSKITSVFEFPFSNDSLTDSLLVFSEEEINHEIPILNKGDDEIGFLIRAKIIRPFDSIRIYSLTENLGLTLSTKFRIKANQEILISTDPRNRYVRLSDGVNESNVLHWISGSFISEWPTLLRGYNVIGYTIEGGSDNDAYVTIEYNEIYAGL